MVISTNPRKGNSGISSTTQQRTATATATEQASRSEHGYDPSYQSYENSQDVVWRVRPDDRTGNPYSMNRLRDKALDIFRKPQSHNESEDNAQKDKGDTNSQFSSFKKETMVGYIDDERVEFELVSDVNQKPEKCHAERFKLEFNDINYKDMSLEEHIRLQMCQWTIAQLCLLYIGIFIMWNLIFAGLFSTLKHSCCGDSELRFSDNFQFSIQTWTTIGYGTLSPVGNYASFWVVINSIISLILNTMFAGLLFLRIVRPSANLQFSKIVAYCNVHGLPCLEIRVGNPEGFNPLIDAVATLKMMWEGSEECDDAEEINSVVITKDLRLLQDSYYTIPSVRTFRHVVDESSPLFGLRLDEFRKMFYLQFRVQATSQTTLSQISMNTVYDHQDILVGRRFQSQVQMNRETGIVLSDFAKMNETNPYCVWYPKRKSPTQVSKPISNPMTSQKRYEYPSQDLKP